jgi:hypothetical protein
MENLSHDFDVLAERADDCGATWAVRMLRRFVADGVTPPAAWPGTLDEARRLVETFAERAGFAERENLATILQSTAEWTWTDSIDVLRVPALAGPLPRDHGSSISWHLDKLSAS